MSQVLVSFAVGLGSRNEKNVKELLSLLIGLTEVIETELNVKAGEVVCFEGVNMV